MTTALVKFTVEDAKSLDELIREADAEARALVKDESARPVFHRATIVSLTSTERIQGEFTL